MVMVDFFSCLPICRAYISWLANAVDHRRTSNEHRERKRARARVCSIPKHTFYTRCELHIHFILILCWKCTRAKHSRREWTRTPRTTKHRQREPTRINDIVINMKQLFWFVTIFFSINQGPSRLLLLFSILNDMFNEKLLFFIV